MKKKLYILLLSIAALSSCGKWLDVNPENQVNEDEMYSTGEGYRIALNGIYTKMASWSLYGKDMSWGLVEVLAQSYNMSDFQATNAYLLASKYEFTDKDVQSKVQAIWSGAYNAVANCNKILKNIENADSQLFIEGEMERQLIMGEALALRAFIQFDILRLFAPAPIKNDTKQYIPYYDTDGSLGNNYLSVNDVIEKVVRDLKAAKVAIAKCDLLPENKSGLSTNSRILANGVTSELHQDVFFAFRGYRMNYYAVAATLARVYMYNQQYDLAAIEAQEVIDAKYNNGSSDVPCFNFTSYTSIAQNLHREDEVIFTIARNEFDKEYRSSTTGSSNNKFIANPPAFPSSSDETGKPTKEDYRVDLILESGGHKFYNQYYSVSKITDDMVPIIRLSEMYYIVAEQLYRKGEVDAAVSKLHEVRMGAGMPASKRPVVTSLEMFLAEIILDMRKSCSGEGQLFPLHKRIDKKLNDDTKFVFDRPFNEN